MTWKSHNKTLQISLQRRKGELTAAENTSAYIILTGQGPELQCLLKVKEDLS